MAVGGWASMEIGCRACYSTRLPFTTYTSSYVLSKLNYPYTKCNENIIVVLELLLLLNVVDGFNIVQRIPERQTNSVKFPKRMFRAI